MKIKLATLTTAILCPLAVILVDRYQKRKGINAKAEVNEEVKLDMKYAASGTNP